MNLQTLIDALPRAAVIGPAEGEVSGLADDSRRVGTGDVFVAVRGAASPMRLSAWSHARVSQ